jgi:hypothetical protein
MFPKELQIEILQSIVSFAEDLLELIAGVAALLAEDGRIKPEVTALETLCIGRVVVDVAVGVRSLGERPGALRG